MDTLQVDKHPGGESPKKTDPKLAESRVAKTKSGHNRTWAECHVARLPSGQFQSKRTHMWPDYQVGRTKSEQNPDLTESAGTKSLVKRFSSRQSFEWSK